MSSPSDLNQQQFQRSRSLSVATVTMQTQPRLQTPVEQEARSARPGSSNRSPVCYDDRLTASNLELHNSRVPTGQQHLTVLPTPPATSSMVDPVSNDGRRPRQPRLHLTVSSQLHGLGIQPVSPATTSSIEHIPREERVPQPYSSDSYSKRSTLPAEHRGMGSWGAEVDSDGSLLPSTQPSPALGAHDDYLGDIHRGLYEQPPSSSNAIEALSLHEGLEDKDTGDQTPLQRFLTPSPADTPTVFTRPAMQQMADVHDGVLTGLQMRDRAERNAAVAARNRERQAGQTELSMDVEGECEYSPQYDL